jgi:hypothetical protein
MFENLKSLIKGEKRLYDAFWLYYIAPNFALNFTVVLLGNKFPNSSAANFLALLFIFIGLIICVIASFSVWRSSKNTMSTFWGGVAEFLIIGAPALTLMEKSGANPSAVSTPILMTTFFIGVGIGLIGWLNIAYIKNKSAKWYKLIDYYIIPYILAFNVILAVIFGQL